MSKQTLREALVKLKQELFDRTDGNGIPLLHYVSNPVCKLVDDALAQPTGSQPPALRARRVDESNTERFVASGSELSGEIAEFATADVIFDALEIKLHAMCASRNGTLTWPEIEAGIELVEAALDSEAPKPCL